MLEKAIPKNPIIKKKWYPAVCPSCGEELSESLGGGYCEHFYGLKFCYCGQRLKWEDNDND